MPAIGYWSKWDWASSCIKVNIPNIITSGWNCSINTANLGNRTVSVTCPSNAKFAIGIVASSTTYSNKPCSVSIRSSYGLHYISNSATDKRCWARIDPGTTISAYTGQNESNTWWMACAVVIYLT